jgi:hypothetical protein
MRCNTAAAARTRHGAVREMHARAAGLCSHGGGGIGHDVQLCMPRPTRIPLQQKADRKVIKWQRGTHKHTQAPASGSEWANFFGSGAPSASSSSAARFAPAISWLSSMLLAHNPPYRHALATKTRGLPAQHAIGRHCRPGAGRLSVLAVKSCWNCPHGAAPIAARPRGIDMHEGMHSNNMRSRTNARAGARPFSLCMVPGQIAKRHAGPVNSGQGQGDSAHSHARSVHHRSELARVMINTCNSVLSLKHWPSHRGATRPYALVSLDRSEREVLA